MFKNVSVAFFLVLLIFSGCLTAKAQRNIASPKSDSESYIRDENVPCETKQPEFNYIYAETVKSFIEKLNDLGKCGYRLEKLTKFSLGDRETPADLDLFAVVKLDTGNKYEYDWFAAADSGELVAELNQSAKRGFYFRKNVLFVKDRCGNDDLEQRRNNESSTPTGIESHSRELSATKGSVFFVERKNAVIKNIEYRVINPFIGWGKSDAKDVNAEMSEYAAQGFHPVAINYLGQLSQYAVVLEKNKDVNSETEYRIIREEFGYLKRINLLGKEGFEPFLAGINFAVLRREKRGKISFSFDFSASYDGIKKRLAKTTKKPGKYFFKGLSDFGCAEPADDNLFFGSSLPDDGKRFEYKMLSMVSVWDKPKKSPIIMKPSPEKLAAFDDLLSKGFEIRELFYSGEIVVLFEKEIK